MKKFVFHLAPVQSLRAYAEKQQKDVLAREQQALNLLEDEAARLEEQKAAWSRRYLRLCEQGARPLQLVRIQTFLSDVRARQAENGRRVRAQRETVENARQLLLERVRDRKSMDALYQKQLSAYAYEQKLQSEKELEDQVSSRLGRAGA